MGRFATLFGQTGRRNAAEIKAPQVLTDIAQSVKRCELFSKLSPAERREALDLDDFYLQSLLDARRGRGTIVHVGVDLSFTSRMTDSDIEEAVRITRLQKQAMAASEAGNHREAIRLLEQIVHIAPFDSISMMSLGVQYANLRNGAEAVRWLERALRVDPDNDRIRRNLSAIKRDFGVA